MITFTRKIDESIYLGPNGEISVKLIGFKGRQAVLAISAPHSIDVHRGEIFHEKMRMKSNNPNGEKLVIISAANDTTVVTRGYN